MGSLANVKQTTIWFSNLYKKFELMSWRSAFLVVVQMSCFSDLTLLVFRFHVAIQPLCSDIQARRRGVSSVLKLCQKLLQQSQVGKGKHNLDDGKLAANVKELWIHLTSKRHELYITHKIYFRNVKFYIYNF